MEAASKPWNFHRDLMRRAFEYLVRTGPLWGCELFACTQFSLCTFVHPSNGRQAVTYIPTNRRRELIAAHASAVWLIAVDSLAAEPDVSRWPGPHGETRLGTSPGNRNLSVTEAGT